MWCSEVLSSIICCAIHEILFDNYSCNIIFWCSNWGVFLIDPFIMNKSMTVIMSQPRSLSIEATLVTQLQPRTMHAALFCILCSFAIRAAVAFAGHSSRLYIIGIWFFFYLSASGVRQVLNQFPNLSLFLTPPVKFDLIHTLWMQKNICSSHLHTWLYWIYSESVTNHF